MKISQPLSAAALLAVTLICGCSNSSGTNPVSAVANSAANAAGNAAGAATNAAGNAAGAVKNAAGTATNAAGSAVAGAAGAVKNAAGTATNAAGSAVAGAAGAVKNAAGTATNAAGSAVTGADGAVTNAAGAATNAAGNAAGAVTGAAGAAAGAAGVELAKFTGSLSSVPTTQSIDGKTVKMTKLPDGVEYFDERVGTGASPKVGDSITTFYKGMLLDGTVFDGTTEHGGQPFPFTIGTGQVIKGWDSGIMGMKIGGRRRLVIPASEGYGPQGNGQIPANATLVFEIELIKVG